VSARQALSDSDDEQLNKAMYQEFERKVMLGAAQRRFKRPAGRAYAKKFVKALAPSVRAAMRACGQPQFKSDASHDLVFVVSASGKIERVLQRAENPYGDCIVSHISFPHIAPKPPDSPWFVQIHLVNGPRDTSKSDQPYATLSLPDTR
jgi:hypothetical protein